MVNENLTRRRILQLGLGAGAGLALWELFHLGINNQLDRTIASPLAFNEIGIDDLRLRRLLDIALENGGEYADVFLEQSMGSYMGFDGERFLNTGVEAVSGAAIRVMANGRTAFRVTGDLSWESLVSTARAARDGIHASPKKSNDGKHTGAARLTRLEVPDLYPVISPALFDSIKEKQGYVTRVVEAAQNSGEHVRKARSNYRDSLRFLSVATSDGVVAYDTQPLLKISASVAVADLDNKKTGIGTFNGGGHYGLEYFKDHSPENLGRRAAEIARNQMDAVEAPSGELPVVLGPAYSGVLLHEAIGHGLEADFNVKGYSAYSNRVGQMVASPLCTIYDDGRRAGLNGSINFDDEGIASAQTLLIDRGRLVSYMHSRETAARMHTAPTGNGRRQGFNFPPIPRMTNTYLQSGSADPGDIIRSVENGIYARAFAGGSANITTGDFTFVPVEAFLIERGRITAPISNVLLLGNGPSILKRVSMVGNDMKISDNLWECGKQGQMVPVTVGTPTIKVEAMTVGGTMKK